MAAELPPSRFKTTGPLASLQRLMGWQAPGLAPKLKHGVTSLANMRPGDFVFFAAYTLAGLVPLLSSFFLTLLEYYGLQLQHLSPNSIALVAIFVHLCEMFVGGAAISVAVPAFLRIEGCEPAPTTHRRLLLPTPDIGHACYITPMSSGLGALERRLGASAGGRQRPARTSCRRFDPRPHRVGDRPRSGVGFRPRAGSDPIPSREWPDLTDGAA
jgi:hypothetical protein